MEHADAIGTLQDEIAKLDSAFRAATHAHSHANANAAPPSATPAPPAPAYDPSTEPLAYRLNPCDIARFAVLAPLGDALAATYRGFTYGTDCQCCLGTRLLIALAAATSAGVLVGRLLT